MNKIEALAVAVVALGSAVASGWFAVNQEWGEWAMWTSITVIAGAVARLQLVEGTKHD